MQYAITTVDDSIACSAADDFITGVTLGIAVASLFVC